MSEPRDTTAWAGVWLDWLAEVLDAELRPLETEELRDLLTALIRERDALRMNFDLLEEHLGKARAHIVDVEWWSDRWKAHAFRIKAERDTLLQRVQQLTGNKEDTRD